ncbi:MAG: amidase family protein, partial [Actinomycetota bacterium]
MAELWQLDASTIARAVATGEASARDVVDAHLERIEALDAEVHAFLTVTADEARAQADAVDAARARGESLGPLA